jgi:hypothetical protein
MYQPVSFSAKMKRAGLLKIVKSVASTRLDAEERARMPVSVNSAAVVIEVVENVLIVSCKRRGALRPTVSCRVNLQAWPEIHDFGTVVDITQ